MSPIRKWGAVITTTVMFCLIFTASSEAATTACFKYNMTVRAQKSVSSDAVRKLPTLRVSGPVSDGWMKVKGGWILLGPPNQVSCGASTNSLPREPKTFGFKPPKVVIRAIKGITAILEQYARDVKKGKEAQAQIALVAFCEKHKADFGWSKCFAQSQKLEVHASRLIATNTNADARLRARGYVGNFLSKDLLGRTQVGLDEVIDTDLNGISAGRWNSKQVKGLESLAERLADSSRVADFERFVSKTHSKLRDASALLKTQHPAFAAEVAKVRKELASPTLTKKQEDLARSGVDPRVFVANEVFLAVDPSARFDKRMSEVESTLPTEGAKFDQTISGIAGAGHDAVFSALNDGSEMTVTAYAKAHDELKPYAEDASNFLSQRDAGDKSPATCNGRKGKGLKDCQQAVQVLTQFSDVVKPSVAAAFASYRVLPESATTEELKTNVQVARDAFTQKFDSFSKSSVVARLQAFAMSNLYAVTGGVVLMIALIISMFRRRNSRVVSHGFDLYPFQS